VYDVFGEVQDVETVITGRLLISLDPRS